MSLVTRGLSTAFLVTAGLGFGASTLVHQNTNIYYVTYRWTVPTSEATAYNFDFVDAYVYVEKVNSILYTFDRFIVIVDSEDINNNRY